MQWKTDFDRSFAEEVAWLGVTDFSVLKLRIQKLAHAYGPLMLDLLQIRPSIQKLNVAIGRGSVSTQFVILYKILTFSLRQDCACFEILIVSPMFLKVQEEEKELCAESCACRHPINWKSETISLPDLEVIVISYDFKVGDEEVDLLKLLFRCAPGLKRVLVRVHENIYKKIHNICKENPHVKCEVTRF